MLRRYRAVLLALFCLPGSGAVVAGAELLLAGEGAAACPIVTTPKPPGPEAAAAKDLARYLKAITGADFPVQVATTAPAGRAILLGALAGAPPPELRGDGFVVRVTADQVAIVGATPRGTAHGVYAFLEDQCGCRWWSHTEEDVPPRPRLAVPVGTRVYNSPFIDTGLYNNEAQRGQGGFSLKQRGDSTFSYVGGHSLYPLLTPYGKEHPEIYPQDAKTGKRAPNDLHFCYLAPGLPEALAAALTPDIEKRKGALATTVFFAGMGDWYGGMCQCAACKAAYEEETWTSPSGAKRPGYSGTLLRAINRTAELLEVKYPGVLVGTFAYMSLEAPPAKTVPRANVIIRVPHLRHCIAHAADRCAKNRGYFEHVARWCTLAPGRVHVWDYGVNFGESFLYPFPVLNSMADNFRAYARLGVAGVMVQGNYVSHGSDLVVLKNWIWAKVLWDPTRPTAEVLREFCAGYYGPAAAGVQAYVEELEGAVADPAGEHFDEFTTLGGMRKAYLTPECERTLRAHLAGALAATAGKEPYERRVREALVSLEAAALWHKGPLVAQDDRLLRADFANEYTWPRAQALVQHCRGASPREWGTGHGYRLGFLTLHGGPLVNLAGGPLRVAVAPALSGRVYQMTWNGQALLDLDEPKDKDYPAELGMTTFGSQRPILYEVVGTPGATSATLRGEGSIGNWSPLPKHATRLTYAVNDAGALTVSVAVRQLVKAEDLDHTMTTSTTRYRLADGQKEPPRVEAEVGGAWQALAFAAGADKDGKPTPPATVVPEGATAVRVALPGAGCVATDRYLAPAVRGGRVIFDRAAKRLVVAVSTVAVAVKLESDTETLRRELSFAPLPPTPAAP